MALMRLLLVLALTACGGWSKRDTILELSVLPADVMDYDQTVRLTQSPDCRVDGCEMNPIIGGHGERVPPAVYFPLTVVVHAAVSMALPRGWWRTTWQAFTTGGEWNAARDNYHHGWGL